jgi:hypothetical protein
MVKRIFLRLKILFLILSCPTLSFAQRISAAQPALESFSPALEWSWTARLRTQVNFVAEQKPSSLQGQTSTDWGSLEFGSFLLHDHEPVEIAFAGHIGPQRDPQHGEPVFQWDELRLSSGNETKISMGLLLDPVVSFDDREWAETSLSSDFDAGVVRWGLLPASDLGLQVMKKTEWGAWTLQLTNGEGWPRRESGPRKDVQLIWEKHVSMDESNLAAQFFAREGGYDNLGEEHTSKRRLGGQFAYRSQIWRVGLTGVSFEDPVDAVNGVFAEGVDLSDNGGEINRGTLGEIWLQYLWGEEASRWRAMVRTAQLRPDSSNSEKDVMSTVWGVGRKIGPGMRLDLLFQKVDFGPQHSASAEDRQRWFLAWVWGLERRPVFAQP